MPMPNPNLQHPDIDYIERNGEPPTFYTDKPEPITCAICERQIDEEQSAYHLCERCEKHAWERFRGLVLNEFNDHERAYINACLEGNSLVEIEKIKPVRAVY